METIKTNVYPTRYTAFDHPGKWVVFAPVDGMYRSCVEDAVPRSVGGLGACITSVGEAAVLAGRTHGYAEVLGYAYEGDIHGIFCKVDHPTGGVIIWAHPAGMRESEAAPQGLAFFVEAVALWITERDMWLAAVADVAWLCTTRRPSCVEYEELRGNEWCTRLASSDWLGMRQVAEGTSSEYTVGHRTYTLLPEVKA